MGTIVAPVEVQPSESDHVPGGPLRGVPRQTVDDRLARPARPEADQLASSKPGLIVAEARPMAPAELERRKVKSGYD